MSEVPLYATPGHTLRAASERSGNTRGLLGRAVEPRAVAPTASSPNLPAAPRPSEAGAPETFQGLPPESHGQNLVPCLPHSHSSGSKPRPESGIDCLMFAISICAMFARQRFERDVLCFREPKSRLVFNRIRGFSSVQNPFQYSTNIHQQLMREVPKGRLGRQMEIIPTGVPRS